MNKLTVKQKEAAVKDVIDVLDTVDDLMIAFATNYGDEFAEKFIVAIKKAIGGDNYFDLEKAIETFKQSI